MCDETSLMERAMADLEMLAAAYPDEISPLTETALADQEISPKLFPLTFTLALPSHNNDCVLQQRQQQQQQHNTTITMEMPLGYPVLQKLEIKSYRCGTGSTKSSVEKMVRVIRRVSAECQNNEEEAGLSVCQAALDSWEESAREESILKVNAMKVRDEAWERERERVNFIEGEDVEWVSGTALVDKKSSFQAHITIVRSELDVTRALRKLIGSSTKIQKATHNMYAYRFSEEGADGKKIMKHDNDDDGEDQAGSRLAHLLEMRDEDGVLVVVSRWYGGTLLGPKRFVHISNVARQLLEQCYDNGFLRR